MNGKRRVSLTLMIVALTALLLLMQAPALAQIDPALVRAAALASEMEPLGDVPVPVPDLVADGVVVDQEALVLLGKALFWDQQIGSDGQACASCHFNAGADTRAKNQLNPNLLNALPDTIFGNSGVDGVPGFPEFGPNYLLTEEDFPLHKLQDAEEENFDLRVVTQDTNDVVSSQGVFNVLFRGVRPGNIIDLGEIVADAVFNVEGVNTRRVEPRNTPTNINAVFNFANFWDGRAHNTFNGQTVVGPLDVNATILVSADGALSEEAFEAANSSLASQAVGPPLSNFEMSFDGRTFPDIGRKVLSQRALKAQFVHPEDSILGEVTRARPRPRGRFCPQRGLKVTYAELVRQAFHPRYWESRDRVVINEDGMRNLQPPRRGNAPSYSQMEANFALFFGLSVQAYQATLVSDDAPLDQFLAGDDAALDQEQLHGLLVFLNRGARGNLPEVDAAIAQAEGMLGVEIGAGNCVSCHGGAEFTDASVRVVEEEPIEIEATLLLVGGLLTLNEAQETLLDNGFANIGVRPTAEDIGRGGTANGFPLSFVRQALAGLPFAPELEVADPGVQQIDGAFKIPGLRNVELTGPYFHNGGQATLGQVVEFYDRQSDFGDVNIAGMDRNMVFVDMGDADEEPLVEFLLALTDDRVRNEQAPFDHPQLFVPNGHPGDQEAIAGVKNHKNKTLQAPTDFFEIPAVGAGGLPAEGLPPIGTFLGLPPVD